jgi:hypothetical protein
VGWLVRNIFKLRHQATFQSHGRILA